MAAPMFQSVSLADWRAKVERELSGKSFEKALVVQTLEGLAISPLYAEGPAVPFARPIGGDGFRVCMRHGAGAEDAEVASDVEGGAEALWLPLQSAYAPKGISPFFVFDVEASSPAAVTQQLTTNLGGRKDFALTVDPIGRCASGQVAAGDLESQLAALGALARSVATSHPGSTSVMVSSLPVHEAGADAAEELAIVLATGATYLERLVGSGLTSAEAAGQLAVQLAVGADTFLELAKLRALRIVWSKLLGAIGVTTPLRLLVHAVCSRRTMTIRDPWVNMLRVTTQTFSAVLGGADLVTPTAFDEASGPPSALGRRVARNTGLVLREESHLGRVRDPAGGSYYLDSLTDMLAREAWNRFRAIEREGGIAPLLTSGKLATRLEAVWRKRLESLARRKSAILGVSEFANLEERLPREESAGAAKATERSGDAVLPSHRDAVLFEALRTRAESKALAPAALLVTLGPLAESRARVGFATGFFAAGGIRTREVAVVERASLACLCGADERYATEAVECIRALKSAGCEKIWVAGRPGALEAALRAAGADGFIFVGCDVVEVLSSLLASEDES